jgi:hypothetical protein
MQEPSLKPDDFLPLDEALNFTDDDIAHNREGRLSARQIRRLQTRNIVSLLGGSLMSVALIGFGAWLVTQGAVVFGGVFILLGTGLFLAVRSGRGKRTAEAALGEIQQIQGPMTLSTAEFKNPNGVMIEYRVQVGEEVFVVSRDAFIAFNEAEADTFTLYYLPTLRVIMSAEP